MKRSIRAVLFAFLFAAAGAQAGDADEILGLLDDFLANADVKSAHERFWAEDLVYTSSRGTRTTREAILASFDEAPADAEQAPGPVYSADEVQLKWYGDTAVVAFKTYIPTAHSAAYKPACVHDMGTTVALPVSQWILSKLLLLLIDLVL